MITPEEILSVRTVVGSQLFSDVDAEMLSRLGFVRVDDILLTPEQAARYLNIASSTLRAWRKAGRVPATYLPHNSRPMFRLGDLRQVERPRIGNPAWVRGMPGSRRKADAS